MKTKDALLERLRQERRRFERKGRMEKCDAAKANEEKEKKKKKKDENSHKQNRTEQKKTKEEDKETNVLCFVFWFLVGQTCSSSSTRSKTTPSF